MHELRPEEARLREQRLRARYERKHSPDDSSDDSEHESPQRNGGFKHEPIEQVLRSCPLSIKAERAEEPASLSQSASAWARAWWESQSGDTQGVSDCEEIKLEVPASPVSSKPTMAPSITPAEKVEEMLVRSAQNLPVPVDVYQTANGGQAWPLPRGNVF